MTHEAKLYFIHATSPIHAGTGAGLDAINLPTARERWTGYPYLPGSSVKGVLREVAERLEEDRKLQQQDVFGAFGPPTEHAGDARGGLVLSDASLLALPVRSLFGTFALVTCPYALTRLRRDAVEANAAAADVLASLDRVIGSDGAKPQVANTHVLAPASDVDLYLEELRIPDLTVSDDVGIVATWISKTLWPTDPSYVSRRLVVVRDDYFGYFTRTAMEIRHRVQIDSTKGTAAKSGPWTEEHLPAETLLHGLVIGRPTKYFKPRSGGTNDTFAGTDVTANATLKTLDMVLRTGGSLRFGGKGTAGMGRARMEVV